MTCRQRVMARISRHEWQLLEIHVHSQTRPSCVAQQLGKHSRSVAIMQKVIVALAALNGASALVPAARHQARSSPLAAATLEVQTSVHVAHTAPGVAAGAPTGRGLSKLQNLCISLRRCESASES